MIYINTSNKIVNSMFSIFLISFWLDIVAYFYNQDELAPFF